MQDMLKKIIEMDEQARLVKEQAIQEKAATENEIIETKKRIYNDYIDRAKVRVEKNLAIDKAHAEKEWAVTESKHNKIIAELENCDKENHDKWVDEIYNHIIG